MKNKNKINYKNKIIGIADMFIPINNVKDIDADFEKEICKNRQLLLSFILSQYVVNGLVRESRGNFHTESWQQEVTIINGGGVWKDELDKYRERKDELFVAKPIIIYRNDIDQQEWCKTYEECCGEETTGRLIYCSKSDCSEKYIYQFTSGLAFSISGNYLYGDFPILRLKK